MLNKSNLVRLRIEGGGPALGLVCRTLSPVVVELIGLAGFDFVWIDMEHTAADLALVEHLCRAADAVGIESLVRVPDKSPANILRVLEAGAGIVNVPGVEERAEAEAVVRAAKYHPIGKRGYCTSSRGSGYGLGKKAEQIFRAANERVMTMVQIESVRGVENAAQICSVSGLDVVFIGVGDLSQDLGVPGQLDHPKVVDSVERVLEAIVAGGKTAAVQAETAEAARRWLERGVSILSCGVDIPIIGKSFLRIREELGLCGSWKGG